MQGRDANFVREILGQLGVYEAQLDHRPALAKNVWFEMNMALRIKMKNRARR